MAEPSSRESCSTTKPGDFTYKACAPFCKAERAQQHCLYCKCQTCDFCAQPTEEHAVARKAVKPASGSSKPASTKPASGSSKPASGSSKPASGSSKPATGSSQPATGSKPPTAGSSSKSTSGGSSKLTSGSKSTGGSSKNNKTKAAKSDGGVQGGSSSAAASADVSTLQQALHAAEARARAAEARLAGVEKQLSMCRHSYARQHGSAAAEPLSLTHRAASVSFRSNATSARQACDEAVEHMHRSLRGADGGAYAGLNASSPPYAVRLYLRQHDSASRCGELPRLASTLDGELAASDAVASALLLVGVMLCGLLNAWSLGYLQPNRHMRRAMQAIGCPVAPLVR
jgi:hypothetical protein